MSDCRIVAGFAGLPTFADLATNAEATYAPQKEHAYENAIYGTLKHRQKDSAKW